jgi:hypothetical protein
LFCSGKEECQSHQCDPYRGADENQPERQRLLRDELAQDKGTSRQIRELLKRLDKDGPSA